MSSTQFRLGRLVIPPMALGTMYFGTTVPERVAMACLDEAYDVGARFWDTANNYAFWAGGTGDESETTIGRWLAGRGPAVRERVVVATKVGARPRTTTGGLDDVLGLSRNAIRAQVHDSLQRLQVDHLDVLYAHIDDQNVPLAESIGTFAELVDEGLVREVAASNLTTARLIEASAVTTDHRYAALQGRFTYLRPRADAHLAPHVLLDDATVALCSDAQLTRLGYSPLLSGAYDRDDRPIPDGYDLTGAALATLDCVSGPHHLSRGQAVLAWMMQRAEPVVPVVGVSLPAQVRAAWDAVTSDLSTTELTLLEEARDA